MEATGQISILRKFEEDANHESGCTWSKNYFNLLDGRFDELFADSSERSFKNVLKNSHYDKWEKCGQYQTDNQCHKGHQGTCNHYGGTVSVRDMYESKNSHYLMELGPNTKKSSRIAESIFGYLRVCSLIVYCQ